MRDDRFRGMMNNLKRANHYIKLTRVTMMEEIPSPKIEPFIKHLDGVAIQIDEAVALMEEALDK